MEFRYKELLRQKFGESPYNVIPLYGNGKIIMYSCSLPSGKVVSIDTSDEKVFIAKE